jgi:predicted metalloprotease
MRPVNSGRRQGTSGRRITVSRNTTGSRTDRLSRRRAGRTRTALGLLAVAVLLSGCAGRSVGGVAKAVDEVDPGTVAGLAVTNDDTVPSGQRDGVGEAALAVDNADHGETDKLAINAVADLYDYWTEQLPNGFDGQRFEPLRRLVSYDSSGRNIEVCRTGTAGQVNAFYCSTDDSIAWDRGELLPRLSEMFGPMAVVAVLAHEMGHAVQFRLGEKSNVNQSTPTIVKEQQADCYAGGFFRWIADGKSKRFQISTGEGLNRVLATMVFIKDPPGTEFTKQGAHGLAFDRVFAFQAGFIEGPTRCAKMDVDDIKKRITEKSFAPDDQNQGNVPINGDNIKLLEESLKLTFKESGAAPPQIKNNGSKCANGKSTSPVTYCPDENVVAIDLRKLGEIGKVPRRANQPLGSSKAIGDFAAFAEIASRYTLSVQKAVGLSLDNEKAGLRTACLTGGWAAVANNDNSQDDELRLSPGDLDEAIAEMLGSQSLIAADVNGRPAQAGFARVEAFRVGYANAKDCTSRFG